MSDASVTPQREPVMDRALMLVATTVILGAIMSILDVTVVNVALNTLARDFHTSLTTVQWVSTGYTLALATVIPLTGWAADRFGTKRLYMTSVGLFLAGSVLSATAWSAESLIVFRVLQGLGGGMLMPAGMTILTRAAGPQRVGRIMGVIGIPMLLGPILGPIIGGVLVDNASWRWIFLINVPIGAAALFFSYRVLPRDVPQPAHRLDWAGLALLSPGLAAIIYGLAKSNSAGGFGHAEVLIPVLAGIAAVAAFVIHATRTPETALIDTRLFRNRTYSASIVTQGLSAVALFGGMLLIPLYLQAVRGESAAATGLLMAPQGLGAMVTMPIAGKLTDRIGTGKIVPFGLLAVGISFALLTQIGAETSYWVLGIELFVMGLGMGASMMPTFSGAIQTLRRSAIARATTTLNINQQVAASMGTAVLSVYLASRISDKLGSGGGGIGQQVSDSARERIAPQMADAFGSTFLVALGLIVVAFVTAAVLLPKRKPDAPVEDDDTAVAEAEAAVLAMA
jgi:EmrB/QacA subfamily drug resistance transporter